MKKWIKLWTRECLSGTIRFEFTPAERGVWYDLLVLAGDCRQEGVIAAGNGVPYPHVWIAGTLNIPLKLLERVIKRCQETDRIMEDNKGIHIINWARYQSEYERQKPYRQAKGISDDPQKFKHQKFGHMIQR